MVAPAGRKRNPEESSVDGGVTDPPTKSPDQLGDGTHDREKQDAGQDREREEKRRRKNATNQSSSP
jgi:hypothetical protein